MQELGPEVFRVAGGEQDGVRAVSVGSGKGGSRGVVFGQCQLGGMSWRGGLLLIGEGVTGGFCVFCV